MEEFFHFFPPPHFASFHDKCCTLPLDRKFHNAARISLLEEKAVIVITTTSALPFTNLSFQI